MFQHGLNYIYHFIINCLAKKFKGQFTCLGENTEKYITFCSVPIENEVKRIGENREEITRITFL